MASWQGILLVLGGILPFVLGQAVPLHTSSRWILDSNDERVKLRCVNWAGHMEANVPEGLHKQPIGFVADWIRDQGFNCVRLTYSIDHALHPDLAVSDSFAAAAASVASNSNSTSDAAAQSMSDLYSQAVAKNPFLASATTRDAFGAVVDELWERGIMTLLDNHVSRASWCCNLTDGNGWWDSAFGYNSWNSRFFDTEAWVSGLEAMATWAAGRPGVVAMSLRNELREFLLQGLDGRRDWYDLVGRAAAAVHAANPDVLVVIGGTQSATDLTHLRAEALDTSRWAGKHVWEFHAYSFTVTFPDPLSTCDVTRAEYGLLDGFVLEQDRAYTGPLILSEFGVGMLGGPADGGLTDRDSAYLDCLTGYMTDNDAEWAVWALQGSYYVRDGTVDADEGWGLLNRDWSDWRNPAFPGLLKGMWNITQGP